MVATSFDEWRSCIVNDCKIKLTKDFAKKRLAVYQDRKNKETRDFIALYGEQHLQNIIYWFKQV